MRHDRLVLTDADLENCIMFATPVEVWQQDSMQESLGFVEKYNDEIVKVNGMYYVRHITEIRIR